VYHGGGGFKHTEVYNMPTWMRKFHIKKINKYLEEQTQEKNNLKNNQESKPNQIFSPNIKPSSTYNFKK